MKSLRRARAGRPVHAWVTTVSPNAGSTSGSLYVATAPLSSVHSSAGAGHHGVGTRPQRVPHVGRGGDASGGYDRRRDAEAHLGDQIGQGHGDRRPSRVSVAKCPPAADARGTSASTPASDACLAVTSAGILPPPAVGTAGIGPPHPHPHPHPHPTGKDLHARQAGTRDATRRSRFRHPDSAARAQRNKPSSVTAASRRASRTTFSTSPSGSRGEELPHLAAPRQSPRSRARHEKCCQEPSGL